MENYIPYILIDSGIDTKNNYLNNTLGGIFFSLDENKEIITSENYNDSNGHGTMCASIIKTVCSIAKPFVIKIVNDKGLTSYKLLVKALEYSMKLDIKIICISLATINKNAYFDIFNVCNNLKNNGKIIISSLHNNYLESYPASLASVIGIAGNDFNGNLNEFWFNSKNKIQGIFDGIPQFVCTKNSRFELFKGNSKATSLATGNVLNIIKGKREYSFEDINFYMDKTSSNNKWDNSELVLSKTFKFIDKDIILEDRDLMIKILEVINKKNNKNLKLKEILNYPIITKTTGINFKNIYDLLKEIENVFDIRFNFKKINAYDVCSLESLTNLVKGLIKNELL